MKWIQAPGLRGLLHLHLESGDKLTKHRKWGCDIIRFVFLKYHTGYDGENGVKEGGPYTGRQDREVPVRVEASQVLLPLPLPVTFLLRAGSDPIGANTADSEH